MYPALLSCIRSGLFVCRHGLDVKAITQAANEVAAVLEGDLPSSVELIDTG